MRLGEEVQALPRRSAASERLTAGPAGARRVLIHVVAAAVIDGAGRVLIAQRPAGKPLAGGWEFPGGKLEPGEAPAEGLKRELAEEIGIAIEHPRPLLKLRHTYAHAEVLLDVWVVRRYRGEPRSLDGQPLRWCSRAALEAVELLPADRPIVAALRLPERLRRRATRDYVLEEFRGFDQLEGPGGAAPGAPPVAGTTRARGPLHGAICRGADEALAAAQRGAELIALCESPAPADLGALCARLSVPVFVRGMTPRRAWSIGASGIHELG